MMATGERQIGRELQEALAADEVGLEVRAEGIATPSDAGNANAGFAEERIVNGDGEGSLRGKPLEQGATNHGEERVSGEAVTGEEAIVGGPIVELLTASGQQSSHSMATETEEAAQREGLRTFGDALLGEGREAFSPELTEGGEDAGRVFFRTEAGG
jgi:hypothetical protein